MLYGSVRGDRDDPVEQRNDLVGGGGEVGVTHLALLGPRKLALSCLELVGQLADLGEPLRSSAGHHDVEAPATTVATL